MRLRQAFQGVNMLAFCTDLAAFSEKYGNKNDSGAVIQFSGKLENVKVSGDAATASLNGNPVRFVRFEGRWYLRVSRD